MKLCVGAPVGDDREWVMDAWLDALSKQTIQPDYIRLVAGRTVPDWLSQMLPANAVAIPSGVPCYTRDQRTGDKSDPNRTKHFSFIRNQLRHLMLATDAHMFFSLDTDILLTDPASIEKLAHVLTHRLYDVVQPTVYLHPAGRESGCYNAAWWCAGAQGDPQRVWARAQESDLPEQALRGLMDIDIPMAAVMMRREVLELCEYKPHEQGEDIGFADSLDEHVFSVGWLTNLETFHPWGPAYLRHPPPEVTDAAS